MALLSGTSTALKPPCTTVSIQSLLRTPESTNRPIVRPDYLSRRQSPRQSPRVRPRVFPTNVPRPFFLDRCPFLDPVKSKHAYRVPRGGLAAFPSTPKFRGAADPASMAAQLYSSIASSKARKEAAAAAAAASGGEVGGKSPSRSGGRRRGGGEGADGGALVVEFPPSLKVWLNIRRYFVGYSDRPACNRVRPASSVLVEQLGDVARPNRSAGKASVLRLERDPKHFPSLSYFHVYPRAILGRMHRDLTDGCLPSMAW